MDKRPYVGLTGFKTKEDVLAANTSYQQFGFLDRSSVHDPDHIPMYGFVSSTKRLKDVSSSGTQMPPLQDLPNLCALSPRGALTALHYFVEGDGDIGHEICDVLKLKTDLYDSGLCRAVQLNHKQWPNPSSVEYLRKQMPELRIIMQVPRQVSQDKPVKEVCDKLLEYRDFGLDYILIDPSGGEGVEFDDGFARTLIKEIEHSLPFSLVGVAGGLSGDNVYEKLEALNLGHKLTCIDATGKLYVDREGGKGFSHVRMHHYLKEASRFFHE